MKATNNRSTIEKQNTSNNKYPDAASTLVASATSTGAAIPSFKGNINAFFCIQEVKLY